MSEPGGVPGRDTVAGVILFPPMLGLDRSEAVPRARLANTIRTPAGDFTTVFLGDRAEVAERLLRGGTREVEAVGSWNAEGTAFSVERFEVLGAEQRHPYQLDQPAAGEVPRDVDLSSLYGGAGPETPSAGPEVTEWPDGWPSPPSEEFEESELSTRQVTLEERRAAMPVDGRRADGERPARQWFAPGQRVVARDRGNVGTVVAFDADREVVRVRFVSSSGTSAVVSFPSEALDLRGPSRSGQPTSSTATEDRRRLGGERRHAVQGADHWGQPPGSDPPGAAPQQRRVGQGRRPAGERPKGRRGGADQGAAGARLEEPPAPAPPPLPVRVLRVHSRRPEPTGELLL